MYKFEYPCICIGVPLPPSGEKPHYICDRKMIAPKIVAFSGIDVTFQGEATAPCTCLSQHGSHVYEPHRSDTAVRMHATPLTPLPAFRNGMVVFHTRSSRDNVMAELFRCPSRPVAPGSVPGRVRCGRRAASCMPSLCSSPACVRLVYRVILPCCKPLTSQTF